MKDPNKWQPQIQIFMFFKFNYIVLIEDFLNTIKFTHEKSIANIHFLLALEQDSAHFYHLYSTC